MNNFLPYFFLFQLSLKVQTSSMFKGKKENYPFSVCRPFLDTRIGKISFFVELNNMYYNIVTMLLISFVLKK